MYIGIIWADWGKVRHAVSKPRERQRVRETELRKGRERERITVLWSQIGLLEFNRMHLIRMKIGARSVGCGTLHGL